MSDRLLAGGGTLFTAAAQFPVAGRRVLGLDPRIELRAHDPAHPKRTAVVELRYGEVEICQPRNARDHSLPPTVRLPLVDVREACPRALDPRINPPEGVEPLHWRLLTTHEITDAAGAWQIVRWYQLRWVIEQLFRVMKSQGLQLEACPRALDPGQPTRFRRKAGQARRGGNKSSVRGYPTHAGPRRYRPDAGVQFVQRTVKRHSRGARADA